MSIYALHRLSSRKDTDTATLPYHLNSKLSFFELSRGAFIDSRCGLLHGNIMLQLYVVAIAAFIATGSYYILPTRERPSKYQIADRTTGRMR